LNITCGFHYVETGIFHWLWLSPVLLH